MKELLSDKSQAVDSISITVCIDIVFRQLGCFFRPKKLSKKLKDVNHLPMYISLYTMRGRP